MADHKIIIPFLRKAEGGLSRAKTDLASKKPCPCSFRAYSASDRKVVTASDWHTNKGITWETFCFWSAHTKRAVDCQLFFQMPDKIWEEIYKTLYWDAIKGDTIKNQGIANLMVDFAWGAGPGTAIRKMQEVLNDQFLKKIPTTSVMGPLTLAAVNKVDTVKLGAYYQAIKLKYYLVDIPGDANDKGWKKRLDDLYNQSIEFIKKNPTTFGVAAFGVVAGLTTVFF